MKIIILLGCIVTIIACSQQKKAEATISNEQQKFCINTFKLYLDVDKERVEISKEFLQLLSKHSDMNNTEEWYQANLAHIDSVMRHCINLVEQEENKKLLDILEKERMNIVAHPNNTVDNEWQLHSVFALLYTKYYEDDKEYWTKLAELGEWSRIHIEAFQMEGKFHPLYKQILSELIQIYDTLGDQSKKIEIEKRIRVFIEETKEDEY